MITIIHGGQTGVDRGAHEAAITNGWQIAGYMPRDHRDERGRIPPEVARHLVEIDKASYTARTEANVRAATAALFVVRNAIDPGETPGTRRTIALATERRLPQRCADSRSDARPLALWIWNDLLTLTTQLQLLEERIPDPVPTRLLVAGPRESKWRGAEAATADLLRRIGTQLSAIASEPGRDRR